MRFEVTEETTRRTQELIESWTDADKEEIRIQYSEYKNAMGPEADRTFAEFAYMRAAMSIAFRMEVELQKMGAYDE